MIPQAVCRDFEQSSKLEWLETNGTGGFSMGTVAGVNTRRYHGLLVASLRPPVERYVLLSRVEEEVSVGGRTWALGACQYPGVVNPSGFELLDEFRRDPCATWRYRMDDVWVEKQVYLIAGREAAVVRYRSNQAIVLCVRPFLAYRDYHSLRRAESDPYHGLPRLQMQHSGRFEENAQWYNNIEYLVELDRGLDFREDLYSPGVIVLQLEPDEWTPICASLGPCEIAEPTPRPDPFVVRRADGKPTIIAGYPWFTDWGRDTMISLPGLLISKGRLDEARQIFEVYLAHMSQGIIPNRFPDSGETPEYNTADATLWMFQAVRQWLQAGGDRDFLDGQFFPAAKQIIEWHRRGTWFGIGVDPQDHLLRAGTPGTQLTWMDAKVGDWVVTPRQGKPVEINALWHGALSLMAKWGAELGDPLAGEYLAEARLVTSSFRHLFWNVERNCLYDVLTNQGPVKKIRPNQIFAVSLPYNLLERARQQAVVRIVEQELLTPAGLRTLEPSDPEYKPRYEGSPLQRDGAYHQGTVWPWLLGPFIDAYLTAFGATEASLAYCQGLVERLVAESSQHGCLESIAEVYDGDPPRRAGGCPAQAWSVAEIARVQAAHRWGSAT
jgi:glycogen debranching enzyme